ncbi:MAG: hypothetical protein II136_07155 [Prevotella sp.]|nr:hypothetical protein [Prevotella sp.]MBQ2060032.1 hypothetical protein [Prevotella sp.]MBQ2337953.1 hypothetical protein [Prevotella sp.]
MRIIAGVRLPIISPQHFPNTANAPQRTPCKRHLKPTHRTALMPKQDPEKAKIKKNLQILSVFLASFAQTLYFCGLTGKASKKLQIKTMAAAFIS